MLNESRACAVVADAATIATVTTMVLMNFICCTPRKTLLPYWQPTVKHGYR